MGARRKQAAGGDPLWFKDAVIYEVHVRAFFDGNGDGCGDFAGLAQKLEYIQDLGVNTIWLLPFYPSPGRDDGYDIADYHNIHPQYGTRAEFRAFVREAHRRNLRVITELVLNHTSDAHPWFQAARRARARLAQARLLRVERHAGQIRRHAHHLPRYRELQLGLGHRSPRPTTGIVSSATSRTSTSTTRTCCARCCAS